MSEMLAGFQHGLIGVVSAQFLADHWVPETVLVVVEVHWQVRAAFLPHLVHLWRLGELQVLVLVGGLTLQLLPPDFLELSRWWFLRSCWDPRWTQARWWRSCRRDKEWGTLWTWRCNPSWLWWRLSGGESTIVEGQQESAGVVEGFLFLFVWKIRGSVLQTKVDIFHSRMILHLFGQTPVVPAKTGNVARQVHVLILRILV